MKVIRAYISNGWRSCLVLETGRKWVRLLPFLPPLRVQKVPLAETRYFKDELLHGHPYPVSRAKKAFRRLALTCYGSVRQAPKTVRAALSGS